MILDVKDLKVHFYEKKQNIEILKGVSFQVKEDTCVGILGESGSGKSMTWKALMGLLSQSFTVDGKVVFKNASLLEMHPKSMRNVRGKDIGIVVQNPMTAFDPLFTIQNQMLETIRCHVKMTRKDAYDLACDTLERMRIYNVQSVMKKYPHELSGGMLQRVMLATAVVLNPSLIIADEPTTAIDCINQVEILRELNHIRETFNVSMLFISHDLGAVKRIADEIIVMADGQIVERGTTHEIMSHPQSIHSKYLVNTHKKMLQTFNAYTEGCCLRVVGS